MSEASASRTSAGGGDAGSRVSASPPHQTISVPLDSFSRFEGQMGPSQSQDTSLALVFSPNSQLSSTPITSSSLVDACGVSNVTSESTQQKSGQMPLQCSDFHLRNANSADIREESMDLETLTSTPLPSNANINIKKGNKRSHFESECNSQAVLSDAESELSTPLSASSRATDRGSPPRHEMAKSRRTEEKTNMYSNQDTPPYAVHIHALVNNRASLPHPMKMFAQVGRVMPAADILEMKKLGNGQILPSHVVLFWSRHGVSPYVPKARICYSCFRAGHVSSSCRSPPRCIYCGNAPHDEGSDCPLKCNTPRCINCSGCDPE